ncbi:hypothetical protein Patl1_30525 [Pistacia atlantica]|uniref:Uncharacterized protein n=1 Tax=Pistacia atlantica TaxID=434234 RepID=A0ACC1ABU5_9ROSI|nr:hypothetical protein Patl1_30525 [Pistacia atlantica]
MALEEEEEQVGEDRDAPAHHPSPPPDELFDISTTVDPSYIISLIRKLLPTNVGTGHADGCDVPSKRLNADPMEKSTDSLSGDGVLSSPKHYFKAMDVVDVGDRSSYFEGEAEDPCSKLEKAGVSAGEEAWEEHGCVLWDLTASVTHAELMVQNLVLEVLLANLMVSQSVRVTEIILGIIGNLACHEVLMKHIVSTNGLIQIIVDQLFLDDTKCLNEACRLLTSCLKSSEPVVWAEALQSEHILQRILWITENTLNPHLMEKSVGLLLAILEGRQEVALLLHPPLMKLDLSSLLINLLTFEMNKLASERIPERYSVLDVILRAVEAFSVLDGHSQEICSNKQLLQLLCNLVKFPEKVEVANSCVTAGVIIANIFSDVPDLATEISSDLPFLLGLLDIFPFASDDLEAQKAFWSVIARSLAEVQEDKMSSSILHQYVSIIMSKSDVIEDDLLDHQLGDSSLEDKSITPCGTNSEARITAYFCFPLPLQQLRSIINILNKWTVSKDEVDKNDLVDYHTDNENVVRLLDRCHKYIE